EAALAAVDILHGALVHRALPGADRPDDAEALRAAQHLALDEQALLAVGVHDEPRRAVTVGRVDVLVPDVHRLEHMSIGVDDVVRARHGSLPSTARIARATQHDEVLVRQEPVLGDQAQAGAPGVAQEPRAGDAAPGRRPALRLLVPVDVDDPGTTSEH